MRTLGLVLIVAGIVSLVFQGISWTRRERVLEIGSLQATVEERERLPLPPVVGGVAIVTGLVLVLSRRRTA